MVVKKRLKSLGLRLTKIRTLKRNLMMVRAKGTWVQERKKSILKMIGLRGKAKEKKRISNPKRKCRNLGTVAKKKNLLKNLTLGRIYH